MTSDRLMNIIESIVYVSGKEIAIKDISDSLGVSDKEVLNAAKNLQKKYSDPCGLNLLIFNKKLQFCSNPSYAEEVSTVLNPIKERELSRSMLETVAIIAYKQPVTRMDLENLRGNSEYALQVLMKIGVIEIVGRKDAVGRPVMFGTTDEFLKRFQISSLDELPDYNELMEKIKAINGTNNQDNYLFRKDEYVEGSEENKTIDFDNLKTAREVKETEFDLDSLQNEEIPDFLEDEDFDVIE